MPDGGPHGDKWNKFSLASVSSDNVLTLLNQTADGKYASSAFVATTSDGTFLYVGYYGESS